MADKNFKVKTSITSPTPIAITEGGTGQTTASNALNALLPVQTSAANKILSTDGTNASWIAQSVAYTRGGVSSRPSSPTAGDLYFNTEKKAFEVYTGSAWVSLISNGAVPLAPTIGTVTVSGLTASVPFTGPSDFGDAAITGYTVTSSPGSITGTGASSPISVSGLTSSTSYTFTVKATNSYGSSLDSSASNSITTASVPGAPTSVTVSDPGTDGYALVSWTAPASNGGSAITDYIIDYSSNSGSSWTTFSDGTSTSTSATVTGLTIGTSYIFRVKAVNVIGTGNASSSSSSFTPATHWSPEGAYDALATVTLSSTTATIAFSGIPSGYKHLELACSLRTDNGTNGGNSVLMQFNNDTKTNYSRHFIGAYNGGTDIAGSASQSSINTHVAPAANGLSNVWGAGIITILDYSSNIKNKTSRSIGGYSQNGTTGYEYVHQMSGGWYSLDPITSISLFAAGSFIAGSTVSLYGVK